MAQALTERQAALRGVPMVLPQVWNGPGQWVVERDVALGYEVQDRGRRKQHLGERREVEPRRATHRHGIWFALRQPEHLHRAIASSRRDAEGGAWYLSGDSLSNGHRRGGEDFGSGHTRRPAWQGFRMASVYDPPRMGPTGCVRSGLVAWLNSLGSLCSFTCARRSEHFPF